MQFMPWDLLCKNKEGRGKLMSMIEGTGSPLTLCLHIREAEARSPMQGRGKLSKELKTQKSCLLVALDLFVERVRILSYCLMHIT